MQGLGAEIYLAGETPLGERLSINGIDDAAAFARAPRDWRGGISTDRIEVIAPLAQARRTRT